MFFKPFHSLDVVSYLYTTERKMDEITPRPKFVVSSCQIDMFIILHNSPNFNTSKAKNETDALHRFDHHYSRLILSLDFNNIICNCGNHSWSTHGYYKRYYHFLGHRIRVRILRIICNVCGKTHALLLEDMIPFSTLPYDEIIAGISDNHQLDISHHTFLINKYKKILQYRSMCLMNIRKLTLHFITT